MWQHLRAWRRQQGLTLQQAAAQLGIAHSTLLRYEKGSLKTPSEALVALAALYGCTPAELEQDPARREQGRRVHDAIELAKSLPPELTDRWLEIGRLLAREAGEPPG